MMDKFHEKTAQERLRQYHQRTKHHLNQYAKGPGGLDWSTQPDPFRRYRGCEYIDLPLSADSLQTPYQALYQPRAIRPQPLILETVAALLELSFGISAWKQYGGERWALRCNPSSGNLHPTEAYCISFHLPGLPAGVYHYVSYDHRLERRCSFAAAFPAQAFPEGVLLLGLSSIHWREAWKYGERAYRYCQHDVGHAMAAVAYAAASLGWRVQPLPHWGDDDLAALLGLNRETDYEGAEREQPDLVLLVGPGLEDLKPPAMDSWLTEIAAAQWQGQANALSPLHRWEWPLIEEVAEICRKPVTQDPPWCASPPPEPLPIPGGFLAADLIRRRRSAQALDGATPISAQAFFRMLEMTLPRPECPPWTAWPWAPRIHLVLFVHRVQGISPGLYLLLRRPDGPMRAALGEEFLWRRPEHCPSHLALYQLLEGDARRVSALISCHQAIAADGAFSLGMIGEFEKVIGAGPWGYRRLFWEAGLIGQMLYLEAEAAGIRGTGIGCYFDDVMHQLLGLRDAQYQSMYHFTLGTPLEDTRLQTLPPYAHLPERRRAVIAVG